MKKNYLTLLIAIALISCSKDPAPPTPTPTTMPERQISLAYMNSFDPTAKFELIVTDSSAHYLLDTILSVQDMHTMKVSSNETTFNITTIDHTESSNTNSVQTYYQVKPDNWIMNSVLAVEFSDTARYSSTPQTQIFYNDIPVLPVGWVAQFGNGFAFSGNSKNWTVTYQKPLPYYAFLTIPKLKLYKYYETNKANDTVSLAKMDTALTLQYQKPFALSDSFRWVSGLRKKNDRSTSVALWSDFFEHNVDYDILYPPTGVEQYIVKYFAVDKNGKWHYTQKLGDVIPVTMEFLDDSYFTVVKNDMKDFEIAFPKTPPSVYSLNISAPKFFWHINLPVGKKTLKGTDKIIDLSKSKTLAGFDFSTVHFDGVSLSKADEYDYVGYYTHIFSVDAYTSTNPIKLFMQY